MDGPQIHVGLARTRLHLGREVHPVELFGPFDAVARLHPTEVLQHKLFRQDELVAEAQLAQKLTGTGCRTDLELPLRQRLTIEDVEHRVHGVYLILLLAIELDLQTSSTNPSI